jgi:hypothetical protein
VGPIFTVLKRNNFNKMLRRDYSQLFLVSLESSCSLLPLTVFHLPPNQTKLSMLQNLPGIGAEIMKNTNSPGKNFGVFSLMHPISYCFPFLLFAAD